MSPAAGFSPRARAVLALANQEAHAWRHEYIGSEHILVGIVAEGSGTGARALAAAGVDLTSLRHTLETMLNQGPRVVLVEHRPQTPRAKHVIEIALREAEALGDGAVGTGHLLLGILGDADSVAAAALVTLGVDFAVTRKRVLHALFAAPREETPADIKHLSAILAESDIPCPGCGYNLRGLISDICPECRQRLQVQVSLADPLGLSYALAMLGLGACGVAAGFLLLAVALVSGWHGWPMGDEFVLLVATPATILAIDAGLVLALGERRGRLWFSRLLRSARRRVTGACWGFSFVVFFVWICIVIWGSM